MENQYRPIGRFFCWILTGLVLLAAATPVHAARTTKVSDTIYRADGLPAAGTLVISWPAFTTVAGEAVASGRMNVKIGANGAVDLALVPNTGSTPASYYTVVIKTDDGVSSTEYWVVPSSASSSVAAVRSKVVPTSVAAQFVGRDYVDTAIAAANRDTSGLVSLSPTASQVLNQPAGTSLQVNHADLANSNGIRYADQFGSLQSAVNDAASTGAVVIPPGYGGTDKFTNSSSRPILDLRRIGDFRGGRLSVLDFGADATAGFYPSVSVTAGSSTVAGVWNATSGLKVGARFCVSGAGAAGADLCTTVAALSGTNPKTVTMSAPATTSVTGRGAYWGADSAAAFQAAINSCANTSYTPYGGCEIDVPVGGYVFGTTISFPAINGIQNGRVLWRCPSGRNGTKLIWTGADQGDMLQAPSNSVPVEINGCSFVSADYLGSTGYTGRRAGIAIHLMGGTQHRIIDNFFGDVYDGIRASNTWLNLIDHNEFYGPYHAAYYGQEGQSAPINATTFSNNELGYYHQFGILQKSNGSGGANGNFYFGNDVEGTSTDTIADVDLNDNYSTFYSNRFETGGSSISGYKSFIFRGSGSWLQMPFCGGEIDGQANQIFCAQGAGAASLAVNANGNVIFGNVPRSNLTGGSAASTVVMSGPDMLADTNGLLDIGLGQAGTSKSSPFLTLDSRNIRAKLAVEGNPLKPNCGSPETFNPGDIVLNKYAQVSSFLSDQVLGWMCVNSVGCACPATASDWREFGELHSRENREASAAPTSGTWNQGDKIWNLSPSGSSPIVGWINTNSGTPGTFSPIYAVDPANPPAWGSATPGAGTFTTISATTSVAAPAAQFSAPVADLSGIAGGPAFWCKADAQAFGDGSSVTSCADSAATPHNASSVGTAPIYKAGITPTGKPALRFAGAGYLQTAAFTLDQAETICGVYAKMIGYSGGALWDGRILNSASHYFAGATQLGLYTNGDGTTNINGAVADDGKFHVVCSVINNPGSAVYVDGVQVASGASGTANMGGVTIGAAGSGVVKVTADIAEVVVFPSALSATNRKLVENYLTQKYITGFVSVKNATGAIVGQFDANGKLSASGAATGFATVPFSATPVFDASTADTFKITLTGNVTGSTLVNVAAGQPLNFIVCQDATGSRSMSWPSNVKGAMTIGSTAGKCNAQSFVFDGANAIAASPGLGNQ
ncbi:MAG: LamG-like jellyroll fold domain-containing protein [Acidobacteriaceae bacterium]